MPREPDFLARLGLDSSADERAIRQTYARLLKQIDQETDAGRFQALREAYEAAIAWQASAGKEDRPHDDAHCGAPAGMPQTPVLASSLHLLQPTPAYGPRFGQRAAPAGVWPALAQADLIDPIDPQAVAGEVHALFLSGLPRLRHGRLQHDESVWTHYLRRRLADRRLLNLAASAAFEAGIADFLAGPREPGHDTLFSAAIKVFGWADERHRLQGLQQAGAKIDRAIDERNMFDAQQLQERHWQRLVLAALRAHDLPKPDQLRRMMPQLEEMIARFPVLMAILVDPDTLLRWRQAFAVLGPVMPRHLAARAAREAPPAVERETSPFTALLCVGLVLLAMGLMVQLFGDRPIAPYSPPQRVPPVAGTSDQAAPRPDQADGGQASARLAPGLLAQSHLDDIRSRLDYTTALDAPPSILVVELEVRLDAEGKVEAIGMLRRSGDQRFDQDVAAAVREAGWFPGATARTVKLTSTGLVTGVQGRVDSVIEAAAADGVR